MVPPSRAIGHKRALEMLLADEMIPAETTLDWAS
jgi:enoyl-CoA hydratase/carnithine racemase